MPIQGKFYTAKELQEILAVTKQRISNLARQEDWISVVPGLYFAEQVEDYLLHRGIDPAGLTVRDYQSETN